jgi:hypothetical protein
MNIKNQNTTPGPWKWHWRSENKEASGSVFAEPRIGHAYAVAMCPRYQTQGQWSADARLIAAAPGLLIELKRAEKFIALSPRNFDVGRLRAAIAGAEGNEQSAHPKTRRAKSNARGKL